MSRCQDKEHVEEDNVDQRLFWTEPMFNYFVEVCLNGSKNGYKKGGGWGDWQWVIGEMRKEGYNATRGQLKHKWDWMKNQWKYWRDLTQRATGLGWDHVKGTIDAPSEWWEDKISKNKNFKKFRDKGVPPELFSKYNELFVGSVATGETQRRPSYSRCGSSGHQHKSTDYVPVMDIDDLEEGSGDSEEDFPANINLENVFGSFDSIHESGGSMSSGKKREAMSTSNTTSKRSKGKNKMTSAEMVSESMLSFNKSYESRTKLMEDKPGCSIQEVMDDVHNLPGVDDCSDTLMIATEIFVKKENREMYMTLRSNKAKLAYLRHQANLSRGFANCFSGY